MKVKLYIKENAKPKFYKPRSVPYILKSKVDEELDRLQKEGIISPVQYSEWAAPIVLVVKQDGNIRVCGDYKLSTANQAAHVETYPLPRIEDLFVQLSGGQTFTKLDLSQAYLQLEVEEECKKYLTINTSKGLFQYNHLPFGVAQRSSNGQWIVCSRGSRGLVILLTTLWLRDVLLKNTWKTWRGSQLNWRKLI